MQFAIVGVDKFGEEEKAMLVKGCVGCKRSSFGTDASARW
jgi:hypothetical protein